MVAYDYQPVCTTTAVFEPQVLVDELDYLPDEVDDMDPQIAAVVIEKSLPRPRAGDLPSFEKQHRAAANTPSTRGVHNHFFSQFARARAPQDVHISVRRVHVVADLLGAAWRGRGAASSGRQQNQPRTGTVRCNTRGSSLGCPARSSQHAGVKVVCVTGNTGEIFTQDNSTTHRWFGPCCYPRPCLHEYSSGRTVGNVPALGPPDTFDGLTTR